ncbi:MAG: succinate dehydrogenase assembly factor 2 [Alphaproteobacteria bacterium]|nr:succinate dehydrogenase assembly factor 2 [Alphaproteobacteria bacterium]
MGVPLEARRKRALYRSRHRGTQELDRLMGAFAEKYVAAMDEMQLAAFEQLLECADPNLFDWLTGRSVAPAEYEGPVLDRIRAFRPAGGTSR